MTDVDASAEQAALTHILDPAASIFLFRFRDEPYAEFRTHAGSLLGVDSSSMVVVGSARLGYSVSPDYPGRAITRRSDVDLVVVSEALFDRAWDHLAEIYPCLGHPPRIRAAYDRHRERSALRGWVNPEDFPGIVPFSGEWFDALQRLAAVVPQRRRVGARLYRSWRHALHYYRWSLERCLAATRRGSP